MAHICCVGDVGVALLLLPAVGGSAAAPTPSAGGQFQISGIVVNAVNDQPLASAYVTITAAQGAAARTVTTGADGAFRFDGVRAGKYQLSAERRGFASQQYQQHEGQFSTAIVAGPDLESANLVFRVLPDASFSGRIADEQGDAVRNARVMLIREQLRRDAPSRRSWRMPPPTIRGTITSPISSRARITWRCRRGRGTRTDRSWASGRSRLRWSRMAAAFRRTRTIRRSMSPIR